MKYSLIPHDAGHQQVPDNPSADYLREAMVQRLSTRGAAFDFSVQLQTDSALRHERNLAPRIEPLP